MKFYGLIKGSGWFDFETLAGALEENGDAAASASGGDQPAADNFPADGAEWIDLFVREMTCATSIDDARARAARLLEVLEKSIRAHASSGATTALQRVYLVLQLLVLTVLVFRIESWEFGKALV